MRTAFTIRGLERDPGLPHYVAHTHLVHAAADILTAHQKIVKITLLTDEGVKATFKRFDPDNLQGKSYRQTYVQCRE